MEESALHLLPSQTLNRTWGRHRNTCWSQSRSSVQSEAGPCLRSWRRMSRSGWFVLVPRWRAVCFSGRWCSSFSGWLLGAWWHLTAGSGGHGTQTRSCRRPSPCGLLGLTHRTTRPCRHTGPWSESRTAGHRCPYSSWLWGHRVLCRWSANLPWCSSGGSDVSPWSASSGSSRSTCHQQTLKRGSKGLWWSRMDLTGPVLKHQTPSLSHVCCSEWQPERTYSSLLQAHQMLGMGPLQPPVEVSSQHENFSKGPSGWPVQATVEKWEHGVYGDAVLQHKQFNWDQIWS